MLILFSFVIQAVSYEYRKKPRNFLGQRTYEIFLIINGVAAPLLIGAAVATFFTGSPFQLNEMMQVHWMTPWRGLDALFVLTNYFLALAVFFLARTLACLFFINTVAHPDIHKRSLKQLSRNAILFVIFLLIFLGIIFCSKGFGIDMEGNIETVSYKYFHNLLEMPANTVLLLIGVVAVLYGIIKTLLHPEWRKGIWFTGCGSILAVIALFILVGFNNTSFYPSTSDLQSSLTIYNASSSEFTLKAMSYVSLIIPFVAAYIWYAWRALTRKPISQEELQTEEHQY